MRSRRLGSAALVIGLGAVGAARAESPTEAVDRYARLKAGAKAFAVQGLALRAGHMQLRVAQGTATPVLAGKETVGLFIHGTGSWEYASETPEEFPALVRDARDASRWKPTAAASRTTLADEFSDLLWVFAGLDAPALAGPDAPPASAELRKQLDLFSRLGTTSLAQRLAYRSLADSARPLAWAQLTGGKNETLYIYDGVLASREQLGVLKKIDIPGMNIEGEYQVLTVSDQPVGGTFRQPSAVRAGLSRLEVDLEADGETAKIRTRGTFLAREEPLRVLGLDLRNRVWEESRRDPRTHKLLRVRDEAGRDLAFDHRRGVLLVALPRAIAPGESVTLEFDAAGDVLYRPQGDNYWLLGFDDWYPNPGLGASSFTFRANVRVRKPFVPLASGREVERKSDGDWNVLRTEFENPVFLPIVMAGKYKIQEEVRNGRTIRIAGYAFAHEHAAKQMINLADQIIRFYEVFLGPFPWKELTIIEINSYGFGVAPPGTMFITQEAFQPIRDDFTRYFSKGLNERYAHEIAHQYWGHQIKWATPEEEWLSESFAEYCAALFIRRLKGEGAYKDMVGYWRSQAKDVGTRATVATANRVVSEKSAEDRTRLLYGKGPYLLAVIHKQLGEEKFLTALKSFQANLKWRYGTTALVQELLQVIDQKPYGDFFDQNYWGTGIPDAPK